MRSSDSMDMYGNCMDLNWTCIDYHGLSMVYQGISRMNSESFHYHRCFFPQPAAESGVAPQRLQWLCV